MIFKFRFYGLFLGFVFRGHWRSKKTVTLKNEPYKQTLKTMIDSPAPIFIACVEKYFLRVFPFSNIPKRVNAIHMLFNEWLCLFLWLILNLSLSHSLFLSLSLLSLSLSLSLSFSLSLPLSLNKPTNYSLKFYFIR